MKQLTKHREKQIRLWRFRKPTCRRQGIQKPQPLTRRQSCLKSHRARSGWLNIAPTFMLEPPSYCCLWCYRDGACVLTKASSRSKHPAQPSLTLFEKLLVSLGLAETPPAPTYLGNPNAPVWVDLHTALYYCSGSDLYGKTAGGKFTTQRDAQLDQFEPAARKTCE